MHDMHIDQATGLRRLFRTPSVRVLPIIGGGTSAARVVALAAHLTATGERVLIIDQALREIAQCCRVVPDGTLADLVRGDAEFDDVSPMTEAGFRLMLAGQGFEAASERGLSAGRIYAAFGELPEPVDLVLVNVAHAHRLARLVDRAGDVLLFADPTESAIAAAYQCLKLAVRADRSVQVVVDGVSTEALAMRTYQRIAATAERFLGVVPGFGGWLAAESVRPQPSTHDSAPHGDYQNGQHAAELSTGQNPLAQLADRILRWRLAEYTQTRAREDAPATVAMAI